MTEIPSEISETALSNGVSQYTDGKWQEEEESKVELDNRLLRCDLFTVFKEAEGQYLQPKYRANERQPRIDRLLIPKQRLIEAGWDVGVIGVECKCSGKKLGPVIAQCQDYGRAVFRTPNGLGVVPEWIFVWPLSAFIGDLASVMTQNRIGGLCGDNYTLLKFKTACGNLMQVDWKNNLDVRRISAGRKVGSR